MQKNAQPFIFSLLIAIGFLGGYFLSSHSSQNVSNSKANSKINDVINYAYDNYVDSVSGETLIDDAISGMLEKLDPHSVYIPKLKLDAISDQLNGSFEGIGVQFRIESDTIIVIEPIANGPSYRKGIMAGDRIVEVDDKNVAGIGIKNEEVLKILKGPKGSKVLLGIIRHGISGIQRFSITRDIIPLHSLDAAFMIDDKTGFIKLNSFSSTTFNEFSKALDKLLSKGMSNLILDLRNNGGGFLNHAVDIADEFLKKGDMIVYTKGLHRKEQVYRGYGRGRFENGKITVLIDEFSASASEIVAGAVQDNDRGLIIGRRSFGKGLVQEQKELKDGSAFRLTVARYYTPSGRCIQRPYQKGYEEYYLDFYKSLILNDSAARNFNLRKNDSLLYYTKNGKKVYGGGGIIPDTLVLHDYDISQQFQIRFFSSGKLIEKVFNYVDKNRNLLKNKFKNEDEFFKGFKAPDILVNSIFQSQEIDANKIDQKDRQIGVAFINAFVGREVYGAETYFKIISKHDNMVKKAIEYFEKN